MTDEEKREGGEHGKRHYEGYTEEQHKQDTEGNNAFIEILRKEVEDKKEKEDSEKDKKVK